MNLHISALSLTFLLGLSLGAPATGAEEAAPTRLEIVDRSIEFHGGDLYRHSVVSFAICSKSGCFDVTTRMDGGLYDHTAEESQGDRRRWARSTNDSIEGREFGKEIPVSESEAQRWRDWVTARVYFALLPFRLTDPSVYQHDLGTVDWEGRELHRVKVTFEGKSSSDASDEFLYWFDPKTARLEFFAYTYVNSDGSRGLRFRKLHNYRRVGGILVFDQENFGREDHSLALEEINPTTVRERLQEVSQIRLEDVEVEPLP
ncbi:MAG: hypothetical protein K8J08_11400 [Thermoanaerobaculia bacterium]|nr:hypothetical protein [Thermoanaerobaculia bacterium]